MINGGSSLKLIALSEAGISPANFPEYEATLRQVLRGGSSLAQTKGLLAASGRILYDQCFGGEGEVGSKIRARAGDLIYQILEAFLKARVALSPDLQGLLAEVVADSQTLSQEQPWLLSIQELSNGDFLAAVCLALLTTPSGQHSALLNYAYLNNFKQWGFVDEKSAGSLRQKIDSTIYSIFRAEFRSSPEQCLLLLPAILTNVFNPLYFAGFLQQVFLETPQAGIRILALESLMVLIGSTTFEWEEFYGSLYKLLQKELTQASFSPVPVPGHPSLLRNKHTLRFMRLLDLALRSESLSKNVVASFVKILLLLATKSCADVTVLLCFLVFNMVKKRQSLKPLMTVPRDFDYTADPFDPQADFYANRVLDSCFWEMELLKRHHDSRAGRTMRSLGGNEVAAPRFEFGELTLGKFDSFAAD